MTTGSTLQAGTWDGSHVSACHRGTDVSAHDAAPEASGIDRLLRGQRLVKGCPCQLLALDSIPRTFQPFTYREDAAKIGTLSPSSKMWSASLDSLFSREKGQWSLHSRLDPVIERWQNLDLPPFLRQSPLQQEDHRDSKAAACIDPGFQQTSCSQPSPKTSAQPSLVDRADAPAYLQRPYIFKHYLIGKLEVLDEAPGWALHA